MADRPRPQVRDTRSESAAGTFAEALAAHQLFRARQHSGCQRSTGADVTCPRGASDTPASSTSPPASRAPTSCATRRAARSVRRSWAGGRSWCGPPEPPAAFRSQSHRHKSLDGLGLTGVGHWTPTARAPARTSRNPEPPAELRGHECRRPRWLRQRRRWHPPGASRRSRH